MTDARFTAHSPLTLDCPEPMRAAVQYVVEGEYESHHDGSGLDILDTYSGVAAREKFFARYDGDGEAGLVSYATDTFREKAIVGAFEVDVIAPEQLASADIVKLDVEGAEAAILAHLDLSKTSLILAEFQNGKNRAAMQAVRVRDFVAFVDEAAPWDPILD